jgi:hypothetical protein
MAKRNKPKSSKPCHFYGKPCMAPVCSAHNGPWEDCRHGGKATKKQAEALLSIIRLAQREAIRKCRPELKGSIDGQPLWPEEVGYNDAIKDSAALARRYFRGRK